ncbi:hypothetical protein QX233_11130 [Chryseobacterium gambrini]|uniref:Uncharacterized protein n=1 Tax=Chryseobacterium gambrini TaxID=373672 RepID=A0AAJ1R671_9FLAO|nr:MULTISPECIES: hypothetical protein [Chryseobacterium]MDN4013017.1 hypothetical protein [Chryseobacterium gambrini]MDN4030706.1 hypothetical protein [Chryseobacterium gambrini]QWA38687.1 hypothetical protein KKI44_00275 [Chryseobacterium sp. ZHDP1]
MKVLFPVLLLCSGWIFSQKTVPADFKKIPEILDNTELLYPFIVPDKKYEYWSVLRNNPDPDKAIVYESQMPDLMTLNDPAPKKGFFQKCLGENCYSYILACEKSRSKYFSNEQQLREFIGFVNNLPEAILIANTFGYSVDSSNPLGSSYKTENQYISLYLSKSKNNSGTKESFFIKINRKTGKLEVKSNGAY